MNEDEELTTEEKELLHDYLAKTGTPVEEGKYNVHSFLHRVATSKDTTKTGFLKDEEVGVPTHPARAFKTFAIISDKIMGNDVFKDYYNQKAEMLTSTSLSRDGFLIRQATTTTKNIADITKKRAKNRGWFGRKDENKQEGDATV